MMYKNVLAAMLMGSLANMASAGVSAGQDGKASDGAETVKVMMVERGPGGKPPYKRSFVELPVVDIAVMEVEEAAKSVRHSNGRPPFNRHK